MQAAQTSRSIADFSPRLPRPAVCCTIVRVAGSAPQSPGARLWATRDGFIGTLGGGEFERRALVDARERLKTGAIAELKEFTLCREMGQCCGGRVWVFFEPVARSKSVHLFGGGHVGRATAEVLSQTGLELHLIDSRLDWGSPDGLPGDVRAHTGDPRRYVKEIAWTEQDAACVFTHSHDLDFELVRSLLSTPVGYLGLIGSEHKARVFEARLESSPGGMELGELWREKVRCPIGEKLPGKNPKVIAVAVAAELLSAWGLP